MSDMNGNGRHAALVFLHAQTSLHPGSGTALGTVDLPIQRERHTLWPTIAASALKGVFRDACRERAKAECPADTQARSRRKWANEEHQQLVAAFGPGDTRRSSEHAGAFAVVDARLVAFPVRSLRGVFAWVTCPTVLERLGRDLVLAHLPPLPEIPKVADERVAVVDNSPLIVPDTKQVILEEFEFAVEGDSAAVAKWLAGRAVADPATQRRLMSHLAVLSDNDFTHFVRHATEVLARIGLNYEHKTVNDGALFYQEFLPAETIFYSLAMASDSRKEGVKMSAAEILAYVQRCIDEIGVLQIGGDESTGKGLCAVRWTQE